MNRIFIIALALLLFVPLTHAGMENKKKSDLSKTTVNFALRVKQGFNMRVWLSNQMAMGLEAWDNLANVPDGFGMEYPTGSGVEHMFGAGPRIGGKVNGVIRVTEGYNGNDARKEFLPELAHLPRERFWRTSTRSYNEPNIRGYDDDNDGKIDEDDLDGFDNDGDWNPTTDDVGADGLADPVEVSCDGKPYDPIKNPDPAGDNYDIGTRDKCHPTSDGGYPYKNNKDIWLEKNGIPDHGEPNVDEDYEAISHNDLYCSATDTFRRPSIIGHVAMGIKVIQKSYAWDADFADAVLPFDYYFINIGKNIITDVYVGFFTDCDLGPVNVPGYPNHNYTAYMESLRTGFIHNPIDRGSTPVGFTVLDAPGNLDSLQYIFQWSDFTTPGRIDPGTNDSAIYTWMNGDAFPGNPIAPPQSPTQLSDTRFYFSFGPFPQFKPGDTLKISMALVSGYGISSGPGNLKENVEKAIKLYSRGYVAPILPVSPLLEIDTLPDPARGIKLKWYPHLNSEGAARGPFTTWDDSNKIAGAYPLSHWRRIDPPCDIPPHVCTADTLPGGRIFGGFRLYRSEFPEDSPSLKKFTLLREYAIPDSAQGLPLDSLVAKYLDSTFVDSPLVRGKRYWYSVTSFGLPDISVIEIPTSEGVRYDTLLTENTESGLFENAIRIDLPFAPSVESGKVLAVPNPYRVDEEYTYESGGWEGLSKRWNENKRKIKFIHMPVGQWTLRIFSLVGDLVTTIQNTPAGGYKRGNQVIDEYRPDRGEIDWDILSESNRALASGVYVFTVESDFETQIGKFVLIR